MIDIPTKIAYYDLETNGRSTSLDRILEVYITKYDLEKGEKHLKYLHSLIQVENNNVDLYAFKKNGWTEEILNDNGRPMKEVMSDTFKFLNEDDDTILCGYVIRTFDNLFLQKMQRRYGFKEFDFENRTFDLALEYKATLAGLYNRFSRKDWRAVHQMVLRNDYSRIIKETGFGLKTEECCKYYGVSVDEKLQHNAEYDTGLNIEILKRQRPEWFPSKTKTSKKNEQQISKRATKTNEPAGIICNPGA